MRLLRLIAALRLWAVRNLALISLAISEKDMPKAR
jgi:hypothetical protein